MPLHCPNARHQNPFAPSDTPCRRAAALYSACRIVRVAMAAVIWQMTPFAPTTAWAQSPPAPVAQSNVPPQPQCPPSAILAALPAMMGSGRVSNPFTGELLSTTLAVCVLNLKPQGDCPAGSAVLAVPGAPSSLCVVPAACSSGYALASTGCCPTGQVTSQGFCCPPGQSPQPNGLCGAP
jgi:hypothetical protein